MFLPSFKRSVFHASIPVAIMWNHISCSVWNLVTRSTHKSFFKRRLVLYFISPWHWLCVLLHSLEVWNVLCDIFSFPWLIALSLWHEGSLVLVCWLQPWWSSRQKMCCVPAIVNCHPHPLNQRHLNRLHVTQPTKCLCTIPPERVHDHLCDSARCLLRARGSVHSSSGWSLSCLHWGGRARVQLSVSALMDELSDFIWAGRTLRWLGPRDCHSWLLYQGLTYRAVILLEQGSQAPRPAAPPPPPPPPVCHAATQGPWPGFLLDWPDACFTPTQGQIHWFICSTLGCKAACCKSLTLAKWY